jgi:hypothetical protein
MAVFAQETPQRPDTRAANPAQQTPAAQQVSVTGCIQREADYRRARNQGRGGVAGSGIGAGNEFVLINASMAPAAGRAPGAPTGTAGTTAEYELTGANEKQASTFVGKRVEIMGMLKAAEESATGKPTGGPTAGKPPEGVDVASADLKLRVL